MGIFSWIVGSITGFPADRTPEFYTKYIDSAVVEAEQWEEAKKIAQQIKAKQSEYMAVQTRTLVPWRMVGALHYMESSLDFRRNLHNGEDWKQVTTKVPVGRGPWNSWLDAAVDALEYDEMDGLMPVDYWTLEHMLYYSEGYNGLGYYRRRKLSPYIWAWTPHYKGGLFVRDRIYNPFEKQKSGGVFAVLKALYALDGIEMPRLKGAPWK